VSFFNPGLAFYYEDGTGNRKSSKQQTVRLRVNIRLPSYFTLPKLQVSSALVIAHHRLARDSEYRSACVRLGGCSREGGTILISSVRGLSKIYLLWTAVNDYLSCQMNRLPGWSPKAVFRKGRCRWHDQTVVVAWSSESLFPRDGLPKDTDACVVRPPLL